MSDPNTSQPQHSPGIRRVESMKGAMLVALGDSGVGNSGTGELATPKLRSLICPFCGGLTPDSGCCDQCTARFDPLSRQASQNEMGPWFLRDTSMPHRPGCNYSTIKRLVETGGIQPNSVLRGPSTHQFWMLAKHTPGVSHLLGFCHNCGKTVEVGAFACNGCHEPFSADRDRQHLGLGPSRPLPGQARVEVLALHAEPPAGAEQVSGPAVLPLESGNGNDQRDPKKSKATRPAASGKEELESIKQIDELNRSVRSLRRAWTAERKKAWISVACAGVITALALILLLTT